MSAHELRSSIPQTVLDLSSDERNALNQLRSELVTDGSAPLQQNATDVTLYRFLRAAGGDVAKARAAVNKYAAWRVSSKADDILSIDYDKEYHTIRQLCPYAYQGVDNEGRPVYWEKTGKIHCAGLAKLIPIEMFQESHVWGMEYMAKRCQEAAVATGKNVDLYCAVLDLTGLGLHHRSVIHYLKTMAEFDQTYYPEKVGKILVLNAPWVVNVLWPMVQVFLDATTKSRIEVITGDLKEGLSKHIDIKYIPKEYGGQGDDIKEYDATEIDAEAKDNLGLTLQNVGAGSTWYQERTCGPEGGAFSWTFISQGGYDIMFSIAREDVETKNSTDPVYVVEPAKVTSARGSYESKGACKLIFKFDNTYSYLTSKDIEYMLSVDPIIEQLHKK